MVHLLQQDITKINILNYQWFLSKPNWDVLGNLGVAPQSELSSDA